MKKYKLEMKSIPKITPTIIYRIVSPSVFVEFSAFSELSSVMIASVDVLGAVVVKSSESMLPSAAEQGYVPVVFD